MHGRVKVRTTAEQEAIKKKERAEKLAQYRIASDIVFQKRKNEIYDDELMMVTERMLLQNSDIYTLWNIRREAFLKNIWTNEVLEEYYKKELTLTENCLKGSPKSYCIWHQRTWVMDRMSEPDWKRELMLCSKCLNLDERNFHCWDYRKFVVERAGISAIEEFDFSTSKILNNFSNYSSWHYRSRLLSQMFHDCDLKTINDKKKDELDLVMNATFTDPSDSSAWFYQRWLLDSHDSSSIVQRALVNENFTILSFVQSLSTELISLQFDDKDMEIEWKSPKGKKFSRLWFGKLKEFTRNFNEVKKVQVSVKGTFYPLNNLNKQWVYENKKGNENCNEQLIEQLASYNQLAEMEPDNKWALLTGVFLMKKIDAFKFHDNILQNLNALLNIDSLRSSYYKDLRSKYIVEHKLCNVQETDVETKFRADLSGLGLTTLSNYENLGFFKEVNVGANFLSYSLHQLSCLQICEKLSVSSNQLENLENFPTLPNLRILSLRNNNLKDPKEILELINKHKLETLDLRQNPVCEAENLRNCVMEASGSLELYIG